MDWTKWQRPHTTIKYENDDVGYNVNNSYSLTSTHQINGVATGFSQLRIRGVNAMYFTDWQWVPGIIRGVQIKTHVSRLARITDLTVQLTENGELVGKNLADYAAEDIHIYGGELLEWKLDDIDISHIGLLLDYQPHYSMPSSEMVYIRNVQMRVAYIPYVIGTIVVGNKTIFDKCNPFPDDFVNYNAEIKSSIQIFKSITGNVSANYSNFIANGNVTTNCTGLVAANIANVVSSTKLIHNAYGSIQSYSSNVYGHEYSP